MRVYRYVTVDVFTQQRFGGNPLAVVTDARGLSDTEMQALAAEFNYSETTFVLPPDDPAHSALVRIFNRAHEMPFAGHPNVGTGYVLAHEGRDIDGVLLFEELAGLVEVRVERNAAGAVIGSTIVAPQPLSCGVELPVEVVASCVSLAPNDVLTETHSPIIASVGVGFLLVEVTGPALTRAAPNSEAFERALDRFAELNGRLSIHLYAVDGPGRLRARMFAPLAGTVEDPATGSANAALAALLLSLTRDERHVFDVVQGVEMGRPSLLHVTAERRENEIRATIRGACVPVFRGEAIL
jgi:trans-2,3-dihydro-3-hydroxyanthranilate isomerase